MPQVLVCNKCRYRIPFTGDWPDACPNCKFDMALPDGDAVVMPHYNTWKSKANDQVYRQMEEASIARAEHAASVAGVPVSEMSHLKITNLNDRRDAPIAAMTGEADAAARRLGMANAGAALTTAAGADYARTALAGQPREGIQAHNRIKRVMGLS